MFKTKQEFEKIFKDYYPMGVLFARKQVHDMDTAKDIVQAVFVKMYEKGDQININTSIKSYVFQAIRNACINHHKHNQTKNRHSKIILDSSSEAVHDNQLEHKEFENQLNGLIDKLPDRCKLIFRLNRFEGKKNKEIAQELDISIRTVETQISKALKFLRENISKEMLYFQSIAIGVFSVFELLGNYLA